MINRLKLVELEKLVKALVFLSVFFLCFENIPKAIRLDTLSSGFSSKLSWYPLVLLGGIGIYDFLKNREHPIGNYRAIKPFLIYLSIYVSVVMVSLIVGLATYPYYDAIFSGPVTQIEKLPYLLGWFHGKGIEITKESVLQGWLFVRLFKGVIFDAIYTFGIAYILYAFISPRVSEYRGLIVKAVLSTVFLIISYSVIEVFYLRGNVWAKGVLEAINPWIHVIKTEHHWWPPLLWKGQLRSVFSEPSRVGNYIGFALPILWTIYLGIKGKLKCTLLLLSVYGMTLMVFLTRARTGNALLFGILLVYSSLVLYMWKREYLFKLLGILLVSSVAFFSVTPALTWGKPEPPVKANKPVVVKSQETIKNAEKYLDDNLASLASNNKRSNKARYTLIYSSIEVIKDNPVLGVGKGLATAFMVDRFTPEQLKDKEVAMWKRNVEKEGILKYSVNAMNEYATKGMEIGLLGLSVYLAPFLIVLWQLLRRLRGAVGVKQLEVLACIATLIGVLASNMNGSSFILYTTWIILPISFAVLHSLKENDPQEMEALR